MKMYVIELRFAMETDINCAWDSPKIYAAVQVDSNYCFYKSPSGGHHYKCSCFDIMLKNCNRMTL